MEVPAEMFLCGALCCWLIPYPCRLPAHKDSILNAHSKDAAQYIICRKNQIKRQHKVGAVFVIKRLEKSSKKQ